MLLQPGDCCIIGCLFKTHRKLKSHEISFTHNIHFSHQIDLKIRKEHGSDAAMLCAEFQNDLPMKQ